MANAVDQVKELLAKNANGDGSVGQGRPEGLDDDGITNDDVSRAARAISGEGEEEHEQLDTGEEEGLEQGFEGEEEDQEGAEGDDEGQAAAQGDEEEDVTLSPTELGEVIGWDPKDVYEGIMVPLDDGQEPVSLGELKNSYQNGQRKITELETKLTEVEEGGQQQSQMAQMSQAMSQLTGYMEQLNQIEQTTDWEDLDEGEAANRRLKLMQAKQETFQKMQQLSVHEQQHRSEYLKKQKARMIDLVPDWKDDAKRKEGQTAIRSHLHTLGFSDAEINRIDDGRTMAMLNHYVSTVKELEELKAATGQAVKKVRKAPKVLRNAQGRFEPQNQGGQQAVNKIVARAKKTGNRSDQVDAVKAVLAQSQKGQSRSVSGRSPSRREVSDRTGRRRR